MTPGIKPAADVVVDASLVQALLQEQHPDLAHLVPARGWALALGLAYLAHSRDDAEMASLGHKTFDAALNEP